MQYTKNDFEMIRLLWSAYRHAEHDDVTLDEESYSTKHCKTVSRATSEALRQILPKHLLEELMEHHEAGLIIDQLKTKGRIFIRETPDGTNGEWAGDHEGGVDKFEADQSEQIRAISQLVSALGYEVVEVNGYWKAEQWEYLTSITTEVFISDTLCQVISCDPSRRVE